ncbi:hypothetical protein DV515_00015119 [Chloebia gouldiae]|uniref:Uncharacterized protein n=1 Tax=Chloebia gouldiae TaxID=44316 RepID=A0A3L8RWC0_CHLGU|nr:hypothetical protein DV515_00015119 [Chloebia gouldiae]
MTPQQNRGSSEVWKGDKTGPVLAGLLPPPPWAEEEDGEAMWAQDTTLAQGKASLSLGLPSRTAMRGIQAGRGFIIFCLFHPSSSSPDPALRNISAPRKLQESPRSWKSVQDTGLGKKITPGTLQRLLDVCHCSAAQTARMTWFGLEGISKFISFHQAGCSWFQCPAWPWALPGIQGQPQLLWAPCARACPASGIPAPAAGAHQRGAADGIGERDSRAPRAVLPLGLCLQPSAPHKELPVGVGCHTLSPMPSPALLLGRGHIPAFQMDSPGTPAWKPKDAPSLEHWDGPWDHLKVSSSALQDARAPYSSRAEEGGRVGTSRPLIRDQTCTHLTPAWLLHPRAPCGTRRLLIPLAEPLSLSSCRVLSGAVGAGSSCQRSRSLTSARLESARGVFDVRITGWLARLPIASRRSRRRGRGAWGDPACWNQPCGERVKGGQEASRGAGAAATEPGGEVDGAIPTPWVLIRSPPAGSWQRPQPCVPQSRVGSAGLGWLCIPSTLLHPCPGMRARLPPSLGSWRSEGKRLVLPQRGGKLGASQGQRGALFSLKTFLSPDPAGKGNQGSGMWATPHPSCTFCSPHEPASQPCRERELEGGKEGELVQGQALLSHSPSPADSTAPPGSSAGTAGPRSTHAGLSVGSRARDFSSSMSSLYFELCEFVLLGPALEEDEEEDEQEDELDSTPGFSLHFVLVLQQRVGHRAQPHMQRHIPPGRRNPGLTAPACRAGHPWHEPPAARAGFSLRECRGIPAAPGTHSLCPAARGIPGCSILHLLLFPARAPRRPGAGRTAPRDPSLPLPFPSLPFPSLPFPSLPFPSLPFPSPRSRRGWGLALCPIRAGTFSPASVPNQSLISALEKVFLLLLTNAILGSSGSAPAGASSAQRRAERASSRILLLSLLPEFIPRAQLWAGVGNVGLAPPEEEEVAAGFTLLPLSLVLAALGARVNQVTPITAPTDIAHRPRGCRPPLAPHIPLDVPGMAGLALSPAGLTPPTLPRGFCCFCLPWEDDGVGKGNGKRKSDPARAGVVAVATRGRWHCPAPGRGTGTSAQPCDPSATSTSVPHGAQAAPSWDVTAFGVPQGGWEQWGGVPALPFLLCLGSQGGAVGLGVAGRMPALTLWLVGHPTEGLWGWGQWGGASLCLVALMKTAQAGAGGGRGRGLQMPFSSSRILITLRAPCPHHGSWPCPLAGGVALGVQHCSPRCHHGTGTNVTPAQDRRGWGLALCPIRAGTFSPASVPNQSLISALEKVFLLLLTNAILGSSGSAPAGASSAQRRAERASSRILLLSLLPEFIPRAQRWAGVGNVGLAPPEEEEVAAGFTLLLLSLVLAALGARVNQVTPITAPTDIAHRPRGCRPPLAPHIPLDVPGMAGLALSPAGLTPPTLPRGFCCFCLPWEDDGVGKGNGKRKSDPARAGAVAVATRGRWHCPAPGRGTGTSAQPCDPSATSTSVPHGAQAAPSWDVTAFGVPQGGWEQWGGVPAFPFLLCLGSQGGAVGLGTAGRMPALTLWLVGHPTEGLWGWGQWGGASLCLVALMKTAQAGAGGGRGRGLQMPFSSSVPSHFNHLESSLRPSRLLALTPGRGGGTGCHHGTGTNVTPAQDALAPVASLGTRPSAGAGRGPEVPGSGHGDLDKAEEWPRRFNNTQCCPGVGPGWDEHWGSPGRRTWGCWGPEPPSPGLSPQQGWGPHLQSCPSPGPSTGRSWSCWSPARGGSRMSRGWSSSAGRKGWHSWDCSPGEEKLWAELREPQETWRETIDKGWRDRTQGMAPTARGQGSWDIGNWELPWHRVPRAAVAAPESLAVPKARLDTGSGSSLGWWDVSLPWQGWMRFFFPSSGSSARDKFLPQTALHGAYSEAAAGAELRQTQPCSGGNNSSGTDKPPGGLWKSFLRMSREDSPAIPLKPAGLRHGGDADGWGAPTRFPCLLSILHFHWPVATSPAPRVAPGLGMAAAPSTGFQPTHLPSRGCGELGGLRAAGGPRHLWAQGDPAPGKHSRLWGEHCQAGREGWAMPRRDGTLGWSWLCHGLWILHPAGDAASPGMGRVPGHGNRLLTPELAGASLLPPTLGQPREEGSRHLQARQWREHPRLLRPANLLCRCAPR